MFATLWQQTGEVPHVCVIKYQNTFYYILYVVEAIAAIRHLYSEIMCRFPGVDNFQVSLGSIPVANLTG